MIGRVLAIGSALAALACGSGSESAGTLAQAVNGGEPAPDQHGVVAVVNFAGGNCSGSLIAPRLVLTARHCVADTAGEEQAVHCGQTPWVAPDSAGALFVVTLPEITDDPDDYLAVSALRLSDPPDSDLCGTDVALLVLEQPISDVTPLVPRLDAPALPGEPFTAIGYGIDESLEDAPGGTRKQLGDRQVLCAGGDCASDVRGNEWLGSDGPCRGDSGGPALDTEQQVIGVLSRGKEGCIEPVFGDLTSRADWLRAEARAAARGSESPPGWACSDAADCDPEKLEESGCSVSPRSRSRARGLWIIAAAAVLARRRFRR